MVVGETFPQSADQILFFALGTQQDGIEDAMLLGVLLELLDELYSIETGHQQVAHHQGDRRVLVEQVNGLAAAVAGNTGETITLKKLTHLFNDKRLVVDN